MPDLVRRTAYTCAQNVAWVREVPGSKDNIYRVVWKYQFEGAAQYAYECSCPAFKYRHSRNVDTCKHIEAVKHERCTWNEELDPTAKPDLVPRLAEEFAAFCPKCHGPCQVMEVAV